MLIVALRKAIDRAEVGLFYGRKIRTVDGDDAVGRSKINGDKILPHQAGEFDCRFAVGFDGGVAVDFHHDVHLVVSQADFLDLPDLHACQLDRIAGLKFLRVAKQPVDVVAAF